MRTKLKPNLDLETIQKHLLMEIVREYDRTSSINKTAKSRGFSNMEVRKALITAGDMVMKPRRKWNEVLRRGNDSRI